MTPAAHREAAAYLRSTCQMSERRACRVIGADRASVRYQATRPDDGDLRERLKALTQERRRFGYCRRHVLLRREGQGGNKKRVQRLYREERPTVRRRGGRKRAIGTRRPIETPLAANRRWSLGFVSDQMTDGRRFHILTVIDNCARISGYGSGLVAGRCRPLATPAEQGSGPSLSLDEKWGSRQPLSMHGRGTRDGSQGGVHQTLTGKR